MVYVGHILTSIADGHAPDPALIDPSLDIDDSEPDREGAGLSYWPSYSRLSPASRAAYLQWLESGRLDSNTNIGYVFLFFYGIERRVLHDAQMSAGAKADIPVLAAEVTRLLEIYAHNNSFRGYATRFLELVQFANPDINVATPCVADDKSWQLPLAIRLGVARLTAEARPLGVDWALAWVRSDPEIPIRTAGNRCRAEFDALFRARYLAQHGDGIRLRPCKTTVGLSYRPANASFGGVVNGSSDLPDVSTLVSPRRELAALTDECCDALDSYSRWIRSHAEAPNDMEAVALLPQELLGTHAPQAFVQLRAKLDSLILGRDRALVAAESVLDAWLPADGSRQTKREGVEASQVLERAGFAMEPDVRFGGKRIQRGDHIVVFRVAQGELAVASREYEQAALVLHLSAVLSWADDTVTDTERAALQQHLLRNAGLSLVERHRLAAHLEWLLADPREFEGLKKRIEALAETERARVAAVVTEVAIADGTASPDEIKALQKLHRLLGLDPGSVHELIHSLHAGGSRRTDPVTVYEPGSSQRGFSIPAPPQEDEQPTVKRHEIDMRAVKAKLTESASVSAMLAGIFADDLTSTPPEPSATVKGESVSGLDGAHSALFAQLRERQTCLRRDFDSLAQSLHLLPDGAIDTLNEAALDVCGVALIEGDDPLAIDVTVYAELERT